MTLSPWYNRVAIPPRTRATAEQINAEFEKIAAAFAQLPAPGAIPAGGGQPNYTWYAYADSADGSSNFTTGQPGNRSYVGIAANRATAVASTHAVDYVWSKLTGSAGSPAPNTILQFSIDNADWHVGYHAGDIYWRQSVDGGSTFTTGAQLTAADLTDLDPVAAAKLDGIEAGADVTTTNTQRMTQVPTFAVMADYQGSVLPGQLPIQFSAHRFKGNTDVTATTTWAITTTPATGLTMTIDNTVGSDTRGMVSLTALSIPSATFTLKSTRDGIDITQVVTIARFDATAPQPTGGTGDTVGGGTHPPGTPASDNSFPAIGSTTSHTAISDVLAVIVGDTGQVNCAAPIGFTTNSQGGIEEGDDPAETFMALKWRHSADGTTGWSDLNTEVIGSSAVRYLNISSKFQVNSPGYTSCSQSKSGLTAGATAYFQLWGRMVAGGHGIVGETGQAVATPA